MTLDMAGRWTAKLDDDKLELSAFGRDQWHEGPARDGKRVGHRYIGAHCLRLEFGRVFDRIATEGLALAGGG